jgi:hypothetical protein
MKRHTTPILLTAPAIGAIAFAVLTVVLSVCGCAWWVWTSTAGAGCLCSLHVGEGGDA